MPRAEFDWQIYDTDAAETALCSILRSFGIEAFEGRSARRLSTPCVELNLETQSVTRQQFLRFSSCKDSKYQPYNTWIFKLKTVVKTERSESADRVHGNLCGKVRAYLQFGWLSTTLTAALLPYHQIMDIREETSTPQFAPEDNVDMTEIIFSGNLQVRDSAWPLEYL